MHGWPNGRINAAFSNSPDVVLRCLKQARKLTQASELLKGARYWRFGCIGSF